MDDHISQTDTASKVVQPAETDTHVNTDVTASVAKPPQIVEELDKTQQDQGEDVASQFGTMQM